MPLTHSTMIHPSNETRQCNIANISKASNIESTHGISLLCWIEPTTLSSKHQQTNFNPLSIKLESCHEATFKRLLVSFEVVTRECAIYVTLPQCDNVGRPFCINKNGHSTMTETKEILH